MISFSYLGCGFGSILLDFHLFPYVIWFWNIASYLSCLCFSPLPPKFAKNTNKQKKTSEDLTSLYLIFKTWKLEVIRKLKWDDKGWEGCCLLHIVLIAHAGSHLSKSSHYEEHKYTYKTFAVFGAEIRNNQKVVFMKRNSLWRPKHNSSHFSLSGRKEKQLKVVHTHKKRTRLVAISRLPWDHTHLRQGLRTSLGPNVAMDTSNCNWPQIQNQGLLPTQVDASTSWAMPN